MKKEIGDADKSESFNYKAVLSDTTIDAGYDGSNVINGTIFNLITMGVIIVVFLILILMRIFCYKFACIKNLFQKLWRKIFWNTFIRSILETSLELCITHMIKLYTLKESNWFESLTSTYSISTLCTIGLLALLLPVFLYCKKS